MQNPFLLLAWPRPTATSWCLIFVFLGEALSLCMVPLHMFLSQNCRFYDIEFWLKIFGISLDSIIDDLHEKLGTLLTIKRGLLYCLSVLVFIVWIGIPCFIYRRVLVCWELISRNGEGETQTRLGLGWLGIKNKLIQFWIFFFLKKKI